ncbi:MAG: hypothetical protein IPH77_14485 [Ignavibacteria bacterium]|nr:hypothetical protein [Ignavibacteria bacterium]
MCLTLKAQPVPVPFDNAWYGFNTQLGNQPYFLDNGRLVDIDNDGDSDVVIVEIFAGLWEQQQVL